MQDQITNSSITSGNSTGIVPIDKKEPKKRGRKRLTFVPKPTPSQLVLSQLKSGSRLSFYSLKAATKLTEDKLTKALVSLVINSREVTSFTRNDTRYYYVRNNQ